MTELPEPLTDQALLALCVWREARGEGEAGMSAVCHVIINRTKSPDFPKTIQYVINQPNAFTSMSVPTDPEFHLYPAATDLEYQFCVALAERALAGQEADPTSGALYYANLATMDSKGWFFRHIVCDPEHHPIKARIGKQVFFG